MVEVVLDQVTRRFSEGVLAVDSASLAVRSGEFFVLVGPSGCGKSTTLRMIAGLEEVSSGEIRIGNRVVNQVCPRDRDIAMVFQHSSLYPHLTVRANLAFGLTMRCGGNWLARQVRRVFRPAIAAELESRRLGIDAQVRSVARALEIEPLLDRLPRQLSGGERQRVALGRAIVRRPAVSLLDEPLASLDTVLRHEMRNYLKQLHRQFRVTTIHVTHDQVEALTLGERIAVMQRGVIHQVGSPQDVFDRPADRFVAGFMSEPAMNFLAGRLKVSGPALTLVADGWDLPIAADQAVKLRENLGEALAGRGIVLGVRPEAVRLTQASSSQPGGVVARVVRVESLGDSAWVVLELAASASPWVAKIDSRREVRASETVKLELDAGRIHWFDEQSGKNIGI